MFSHLRAVLLATGTLVLLGAVHAVSTATAEPQAELTPSPMLASAPVQGVRFAEVRSLTGVSLRAVAIGY
jgi:hypothetical protein